MRGRAIIKCSIGGQSGKSDKRRLHSLTRSSGSSYLNGFELQNSCLSLGHSNTFIPYTLSGPNVSQESGKMDETRLRENLSLAISACINRIKGCPCGDTSIQLIYCGRVSCL